MSVEVLSVIACTQPENTSFTFFHRSDVDKVDLRVLKFGGHADS